MKFRIERDVPFSRDDVYGWWTDFRQDDHVPQDSPAQSHREVLRTTGNELWMRDHATKPLRVTIEEHVTLEPPNGYRVEAGYPAADVRYAYRFDAIATGTHILLDAELRPRHIGRIVYPLLRAAAIRYSERDTDFHLAQMRRDLTRR
jgi:hypothetical protein